MPRREISIDYQVVQLAAASIAHPGSQPHFLDRAVVRERPYSAIPGSTIKGCLRGASERLAQSLELTVCDRPANCRLGDQCVTCRFFGNPSMEAALAWSDATVHPEVADLLSSTSLSETRSRMPRDRVTGGGGVPRSTATIATMPEGMMYLGSARGWLPVEQPDTDRSRLPVSVLLVLAALRLITSLGGGRSVGLGAYRFEVATVGWGDVLLSADRAMAQLDRLGVVEVA